MKLQNISVLYQIPLEELAALRQGFLCKGVPLGETYNGMREEDRDVAEATQVLAST